MNVICPDCAAASQLSEVRELGPKKSVKVPGAKDDVFWDGGGNKHTHRKLSGWAQRYKCSQTPPHIFEVVEPVKGCFCGYPNSGPYVE